MSNLGSLAQDELPSGLSHALLRDLAGHHHAVHFYHDDAALLDTVCPFLRAGLRADDRVLIIAAEDHRRGILERLESPRLTKAIESGSVIVADAHETLARFMIGGMPDRALFRHVLSTFLLKLRGDGATPPSVRAYGEMVDILWRQGEVNAAIRLEELWNEAQEEHSFKLLCAYVMGNFYNEGDEKHFVKVCDTHDLVFPIQRSTEGGDPAARLSELSLLRSRTHALELEIAHRVELEQALRVALRERTQAEQELRECVEREREARARAEASDAFKEVFFGILGHDLRNPLNTILTTVRLMNIRKELAPESQNRLNRVLSSGLRMQRMIDQLLDVTRVRLAGGIPVAPIEGQDVVAIIAKIVDELRHGCAEHTIVLRAPERCLARIDPDRFEQVVSNLVGNAVMHGDSRSPVNVTVDERPGEVRISVQNCGDPIDPAFLSMLFDPFARGGQPQRGSAGLGLGLYISDQIVAAHQGRIEVESTKGSTLFQVVLPRRELP